MFTICKHKNQEPFFFVNYSAAMVIQGVYVETFEEDALYGCLNFLCIQFRYTTGWTDCALLVGLSIAWGVGDATFQTQIGALLGILYPHDTVSTPSL
jgi:hypothetical protein